MRRKAIVEEEVGIKDLQMKMCGRLKEMWLNGFYKKKEQTNRIHTQK